MFGIVLAAIAVVCCGIACAVDLLVKKYLSAVLFGVLALVNVYILCYDIKKLNEPIEPHRVQIENVIKYDVDSTTVINGSDTTKTYTIYYYKY